MRLVDSCQNQGITFFKVNEKNKGKAACLNNIISEVDTDHLMFLDSDDVFLPGKISLQLSYKQSFGECVMGSGYYIYQHPLGFTDQFVPNDRPEDIATNFIFFPHMLFSSILVSLDTINRYLGSSPFNDLLVGGIDYEFYSRLLPNVPFRNLPLPLVAYKLSKDGITSSSSTRLEQIKTHISAVQKMLKPSCLLAKLPTQAIMKCLFYKKAIDSSIGKQLYSDHNIGIAIKELTKKIESEDPSNVCSFTVGSSGISPRESVIRQQILRNLDSW